jgi:hypothetical protein
MANFFALSTNGSTSVMFDGTRFSQAKNIMSSLLIEATTGSISAVIANTIVYPLDVITSRIQVSSTSKLSILEYIRKRGIRGFYVGIYISLFQTFLSNFGYFWFYALVKRLYARYNTRPSTGIELFLGAIAGALSRTITTPVSVITMRKQTIDDPKGRQYSMICKKIFKEEGIRGFWRGYGASLILTINPAITYGLFERIKEVGKKTRREIFLMGAFTKSIATIFTYPYILAKSQLQARDELQSISQCFHVAMKEDGVYGLYKVCTSYFRGFLHNYPKQYCVKHFCFHLKITWIDYIDLC